MHGVAGEWFAHVFRDLDCGACCKYCINCKYNENLGTVFQDIRILRKKAHYGQVVI